MNLESDSNQNVDEDSFDPAIFKDLLPTYYQRLFPFALYYKWLRYNDEKNTVFMNREFSFTLENDVYIRYQSFKDDVEMKKEILQKCPHKIDIGAVYSFRPREQRTVSSFHPVEKELVFDIDMTDYDEVRTCCSGADICRKCWPLMTVAMKILDRALREDFGFKHLLWVYSGRRGIHCWVCDESARKLSSVARSAIVEYLTVVKGGEFKAKKVRFPDMLHPSINEAQKIINRYFEDLVLDKQGLLDSQENCEKVAALCLDLNVREIIKNDLPRFESSRAKWAELKKIEDIALNQKGTGNKNKNFLLEVMFQMCYPRLDVNVSKGLNHLLKAPFCVHPKTGRICVPIDVKHADSFDPLSVPTISGVCEEMNKYHAKMKEEEKINGNSDVEGSDLTKKNQESCKTSLNKSIEIFESFVNRLNSDLS